MNKKVLSFFLIGFLIYLFDYSFNENEDENVIIIYDDEIQVLIKNWNEQVGRPPREEDIRGALDKKQEDDRANKIADNEDNISETLSNDNETSLGDSLDVSEKRQDEIDFQLSRALDLIRGASVFNSLKK